LIHLVQDVTILRPLVFMAARDFGFDSLFLVSTKFTARDALGIWRQELEEISAECGARVEYFDDDWEAHKHLTGEGLLFSASESHLHNHSTTHDVFRHAPRGYLRVTLQHGFECVGFRHAADHTRAHGESVSFGADIVCSWTSGDRLVSMASSQRNKLVVTGPTSVLQLPVERAARIEATGIVCENLHSVRFKGARDSKLEFVAIFEDFARRMAKRKKQVRLRAHPGGQYYLRHRIAVPANVVIENAPIYRLDLRQFAYGISAPSSVLIDMLLAGIPTAVWIDRRGTIDASCYEGLAVVSSARDWERFATAAATDPSPFLEAQRQFLVRSGMPLDPQDVFCRFAELFEAARRMDVRSPASSVERERLLFIADKGPSALKSTVERILAPLVASGEIATSFVTWRALGSKFDDGDPDLECIGRKLAHVNPSLVLIGDDEKTICKAVLDWAGERNVPVVALTHTVHDKRRAQCDEIPTDGEESWISGLDLLINNVDERVTIGGRVQPEQEGQSSAARLREQLLDIILRAHEIVRSRCNQGAKIKEVSVCQIR
jgi:hypothetical protein